MAYQYPRWEYIITADDHGGNAMKHRAEMQCIAHDVSKRVAKEIAEQVFDEKMTAFFNALEYTVETAVEISINDADKILDEKRVSKLLVENIMGTIKKEFEGKTYGAKK